MLTRLAIVGRPNVGKSSLFNRLVGRRVSIVDPTPGVTRDRINHVVEIDPPAEMKNDLEPKLVDLIDTGGLGVYTSQDGRFDDAGEDLSKLTESIESQIQAAVDQSDLILFVIDAQEGIVALDRMVADLLRRKDATDRVILVANKVDDESWMSHSHDATSLGLGDPLVISATSGYGIRDFMSSLYDRVPTGGDREPDPVCRFAIIGSRNAGKSTFINALAGEPRVIVSEIAGTTRDSVDVEFEIDGNRLLAIDTAGLRKTKSFADDVEFYASTRVSNAMRRADVVMLMVDATAKVTQVDKKISKNLQDLYKPTVIVITKWDLVEKDLKPDDYIDYLTQELRGLDYAPIVFVSSVNGDGVSEAALMACNLHAQASHRAGTGMLNSVVEDILQRRGPSPRLGQRAKIYFASQVDTNPPTIVLMVNNPKLFSPGYRRYIMNRLHEELPFSEVPIRLLFKPRSRVSLNQLKGGEHRHQA